METHQTENIQDWLAAGGEPVFVLDVFDLYEATKGESVGRYDSFKRGKHVFIKAPDAGRLHLDGARAVRQFRKEIEKRNPHPELGMHGAEAYVLQMMK